MSPAQKRALVGLALLALLAIAIVAWGLTRPDCDHCDKDFKPSKGWKTLGRVFGMARPHLKLPVSHFELQQGQRRDVEIAGWDGDMRSLELQQRRGTVAMSLAVVERAKDPDLHQQTSPTTLPREMDDPDDNHRLTYAVTSAGGRLQLFCEAGPCVVDAR
jgi:hypothetical protein